MKTVVPATDSSHTYLKNYIFNKGNSFFENIIINRHLKCK